MPSRIIVQGRTAYASRNTPKRVHRASDALNLDSQGDPVDVSTAIPPTYPPSAYQLGLTFRDRDENVDYRVLKKLSPAEGWASAQFWYRRWQCNGSDFVEILRAGYMLAAIEEGSTVRRYLCLNERELKDSSLWLRLRKKQKAREARELEKARNLGKFFGFKPAAR